MTGARGWVLLLASCAATFAGTTIYLWRELADERAQVPAPRAAAPRMVVPAASQPRIVFNTSGQATRPGPPAPRANRLDPNVEPDEYLRQQSKLLLEQLADPAARARLLEESRNSVRNAYPWLAERLKLGPEEYEKLIDLLARRDLERREAFAKCAADGACSSGQPGQFNYDQEVQPVADLLGPERMKQFETYQQTMNERETVLNLRGRLPDQAWLSTEQSEALITALADESYQAQRDAQLAGHSVAGFGMNGGWIYYENQGTVQQQVRSAEAYVNRMIARAAAELTAEQLRYFTQMQQDLLANLRYQIEKIEGEKQQR
ncbi:MAG TPA: hypothetical protein VFL16_18505 [Steroidobacteraceae bacterium]|nr:hypothetical protein [Steroidobacteraceae bacterium]